jgi:hypothetical protein
LEDFESSKRFFVNNFLIFNILNTIFTANTFYYAVAVYLCRAF